MDYKKRIIIIVFFVVSLRAFILADDKKFAFGVNTGCFYDFDDKFRPYVGMNCQYKVSSSLTLQVELDYYPEFVEFHKSGVGGRNYFFPSINGIWTLKTKSTNIVPYFSFGIGLVGVEPHYFPSFPAVWGMYRIGGGLRFLLSRYGFMSADVCFHGGTFYFVPVFVKFISLNTGYAVIF
jgi:hypothetical protein